jgi:hypothetical protein
MSALTIALDGKTNRKLREGRIEVEGKSLE